MKSILFFGFAVISTTAFGQDLSKKVTFQEMATPAPRLVADLAKAAGVKLTADPEMAREVLLISVNDVALSDLMMKIAKVSSGRWARTNTGYDLEPDRAAREKQARDELQLRLNQIKNATEPDPAEPAHAPPTDKPKAGEKPAPSQPPPPPKKAEEGTPDSDEDESEARLSDVVMRLINPMAIATLPEGERLVFSSNPTPMQLPLGDLPSGFMSDFIKRHNVEAEADRKELEKIIKEARNPEEAESYRAATEFTAKPMNVPPAKLLVLVEAGTSSGLWSNGSSGRVSIEIQLFDQSGHMQYSETAGAFDFELTRDSSEEDDAPSPSPKKPSGAPIVFTPISKDILKATSGGTPFLELSKLSPETRSRLQHPEVFDPLSFAYSDALVSAAHDKDENLVADLPDSLGTYPISSTALKSGEYLEQVTKAQKVLIMQEVGGWMEISPNYPLASRAQRLDRQALSDLINTSTQKGTLSLDDMAQYAVRNDEPGLDSVGGLYFELFAPQLMFRGFMGRNAWDMLRFYGVLDPSHKDSLRSDGKLSVADLSPAEFALLRQMTFGTDRKLEVHRPGDLPQPKAWNFMGYVGYQPRKPANDYLDEPTEALPSGIPRNAQLSLRLERQIIFRPPNLPQASEIGAIGVDEYSLFRFSAQQAKNSGSNGNILGLGKCQLGGRLLYNFNFQLSPSISITRILSDDVIAKDAPFVTEADLPKEFLDAVAARVEEIKAAVRKSSEGMSGGYRPPAPPP